MSEIKTLRQRIDDCIEKYGCKYHQLPNFENPHGCTDCYNIGYIFDNEEVHLLIETDQKLSDCLQLLRELDADLEGDYQFYGLYRDRIKELLGNDKQEG